MKQVFPSVSGGMAVVAIFIVVEDPEFGPLEIRTWSVGATNALALSAFRHQCPGLKISRFESLTDKPQPQPTTL